MDCSVLEWIALSTSREEMGCEGWGLRPEANPLTLPTHLSWDCDWP